MKLRPTCPLPLARSLSSSRRGVSIAPAHRNKRAAGLALLAPIPRRRRRPRQRRACPARSGSQSTGRGFPPRASARAARTSRPCSPSPPCCTPPGRSRGWCRPRRQPDARLVVRPGQRGIGGRRRSQAQFGAQPRRISCAAPLSGRAAADRPRGAAAPRGRATGRRCRETLQLIVVRLQVVICQRPVVAHAELRVQAQVVGLDTRRVRRVVQGRAADAGPRVVPARRRWGPRPRSAARRSRTAPTGRARQWRSPGRVPRSARLPAPPPSVRPGPIGPAAAPARARADHDGVHHLLGRVGRIRRVHRSRLSQGQPAPTPRARPGRCAASPEHPPCRHSRSPPARAGGCSRSR